MSTQFALPPQLGSWTQVDVKAVSQLASPPVLLYSNDQSTTIATPNTKEFEMYMPQNTPFHMAQGQPLQTGAMTVQPMTQPPTIAPQMPQSVYNAPMTESQIRSMLPKTTVIHLDNGGTRQCPPPLLACRLLPEQYIAIVTRVASLKSNYNREKKSKIFWFGLLGYLMFRNHNPHLRDQLAIILNNYNHKLANEGVAVRFIWSSGQLIACHL